MKRLITIAAVVALVVATSFIFYGAIGTKSTADVRLFDFNYSFAVQNIPDDTQSIKAWVPFPANNLYQKVVDYAVNSKYPYTILTELENGNRFIQFNLSKDLENNEVDPRISLTFRVERKSYNALDKGDDPYIATAGLDRYLSANRLVPVDGIIAEEAARVVGTTQDKLSQARLLYDYIVSSVTYDKSGDAWGRGDAIYACNARTGNCTDFHSLFMGEARSLGIPARFVMGFPLPEDKSEGDVLGYHCWAEFWIKGYGWIPIDASEAHKHPEKKEMLFGGLDNNRIQFTIGRDIRIPQSQAKLANYAIYPYVEVDGQPFENVTWDFSFENVNIAY